MRKRLNDQRGAAAVEFALVLPIFVLLLFGMIQYGFYFWTAETTNSSARETARRVVVGDCWNSSDRDDFAREHAPQMTGSVTVSPGPSGNSVGQQVTVTVTADANLINFLPMPNGGVVTRSYEARMEVDVQSVAAKDSCAP